MSKQSKNPAERVSNLLMAHPDVKGYIDVSAETDINMSKWTVNVIGKAPEELVKLMVALVFPSNRPVDVILNSKKLDLYV